MITIRRFAGALLLTTVLSGCGGVGLMLFPIGIGIGAGVNHAVVAMNRSLADALGRGLACALQSGFNFFGPRVGITVEQVELNFVADQIREKNITDPKVLWQQLDADESAHLLNLVKSDYDALPANSEVRRRPLEFYTGLLAMGLLNVTRDRAQARMFTFGRHILVGHDPERFENYLLSVGVRHSGTDATKNYATCE